MKKSDVLIHESDEELEEALRDFNENVVIINHRPKNGGKGKTKNLLESIHVPFEEKGRFKTKNTSSPYTFEIWHDNGMMKFFWTTRPDSERHMRKQLNEHFPDARMETTNDIFIDVPEEDYYITGGEAILDRHFLEPISSPSSEPFKKLLATIDNRAETEFFYQVVFKPAIRNWEKTLTRSPDDYEPTTRKLLGGILGGSGGLTEEEEKMINQIKNKGSEEVVFNCSIRYFMIGRDKALLKKDALSFHKLFERSFRNENQNLKFVSLSEQGVKNIINQSINRRGNHMDQVSKLKFWEEISNNKRIYLTSDELSGLAHIPSKGSVNLDSIVWVNVPPSRIPPFVEKFEPLSYEEKLKIRKDLSKHRTLFRQELEKNFGGDNNE